MISLARPRGPRGFNPFGNQVYRFGNRFPMGFRYGLEMVETMFPVLEALLGLVAGLSLAYAWFKTREAEALHLEIAALRRRVTVLEKQLKAARYTVPEIDIDARILELRARGYSLRQIAREVGLSHTAVRKRLLKLEAQLAQRPPRREPLPLEA